MIEATFGCITRKLEDDLGGDEQIMKEAWEEADDDEEDEFIKDLLRGILDSLGALQKNEIFKAEGGEL